MIPDTEWTIVRPGVIALPTTRYEIRYFPGSNIPFRLHWGGGDASFERGYATLDAAKTGALEHARDILALGLDAQNGSSALGTSRGISKMMEHTPGPWAVEGDDREGMEWNNHIVIADRPDDRICFMAHNGPTHQVEFDANAHLIAAAPDLLAALEAQENAEDANANCEECEGQGIPELCVCCFPLFDDARLKRRAAIAKAKGEDQ